MGELHKIAGQLRETWRFINLPFAPGPTPGISFAPPPAGRLLQELPMPHYGRKGNGRKGRSGPSGALRHNSVSEQNVSSRLPSPVKIPGLHSFRKKIKKLILEERWNFNDYVKSDKLFLKKLKFFYFLCNLFAS